MLGARLVGDIRWLLSWQRVVIHLRFLKYYMYVVPVEFLLLSTLTFEVCPLNLVLIRLGPVWEQTLVKEDMTMPLYNCLINYLSKI